MEHPLPPFYIQLALFYCVLERNVKSKVENGKEISITPRGRCCIVSFFLIDIGDIK